MITRILQKFQRKEQLSLLKKSTNTRIGSIRIGIDNQFVLYPYLKKIRFGNGFVFRNFVHIIVQNNAELVIEDCVFLNNFCSINCLERIEIGENTLFGENVKIYDHNHSYTRSESNLSVFHSEFSTAPVIIGKNCWLGSNVTILKGVTIGENCIIGAGCTVYKDIPANTTVLQKQDLILKQH